MYIYLSKASQPYVFEVIDSLLFVSMSDLPSLVPPSAYPNLQNRGLDPRILSMQNLRRPLKVYYDEVTNRYDVTSEAETFIEDVWTSTSDHVGSLIQLTTGIPNPLANPQNPYNARPSLEAERQPLHLTTMPVFQIIPRELTPHETGAHSSPTYSPQLRPTISSSFGWPSLVRPAGEDNCIGTSHAMDISSYIPTGDHAQHLVDQSGMVTAPNQLSLNSSSVLSHSETRQFVGSVPTAAGLSSYAVTPLPLSQRNSSDLFASCPSISVGPWFKKGSMFKRKGRSSGLLTARIPKGLSSSEQQHRPPTPRQGSLLLPSVSTNHCSGQPCWHARWRQKSQQPWSRHCWHGCSSYTDHKPTTRHSIISATFRQCDIFKGGFHTIAGNDDGKQHR